MDATEDAQRNFIEKHVMKLQEIKFYVVIYVYMGKILLFLFEHKYLHDTMTSWGFRAPRGCS
jgi:hypothetical protein